MNNELTEGKSAEQPVAWMNKLGATTFRKTGDCNIPLYIHPAKTKYLSLQKTEDGELAAVTYTDDEHRIIEVLWERPPAKTLTDEEITEVYDSCKSNNCIEFARAILRKAQDERK